ncbi:MAG TPA: hypothetical protein VH542_01690 [Steroidobacteraceae bacterium]
MYIRSVLRRAISISQNRAAARSPLVADRGPARCPACQAYLEFRTDRFGRMLEHCACGHRALVERRSGKRDGPAEPTQ